MPADALRHDYGPLGLKKNWVTEVGGLPPMIRDVAHALIRNGHSESGAIQIAIGAVKRWAAGLGHVHPDTIAKAAAAVAQWEAMKAARSDERGAPPAAGSAYAAGHPFHGNQHTVVAGSKAGGKAIAPSAKGGAAGGGKGGAAGGAAGAAATKAAAALAAVTTAKNAYTHAQATAAAADQHLAQAQAAAVTDVKFAQDREKGNTPNAQANLIAADSMQALKTAKANAITTAQAAATAAHANLAQAQTAVEKAMKAAGFRDDEDVEVRDLGEGNPPGTDPSGAATLLPVGPSKKQSAAITHRFKGRDLAHCEECDEPILAPIHTTSAAKAQPIAPVPRQSTLHRQRTEWLPHQVMPEHLTSLEVRSRAHRHVMAAYDENQKNISQVEGPLTDALKGHFADQRKQTIYRLEGKRGKQMMKRATDLLRAAGDANSPPVIPPEDGPEGPPPPGVAVNPGSIFDTAFWTTKTAQVLQPHLATAGALAANAIKSQVGIGMGTVDDSTSLGNVQGLLAARAQAASQYITGTTAKQLTDALQQGVANGEGMAAIAKRVNEVFDNADIVRAKQIAQTEVVGAYNEGGHAYASGLPDGIVGKHRWLAHKDARTRPTHRLADGQEQPLDQPFWVGGSAMMHPGDHAAPIGEWINCRCSTAFLAPNMSYDPIKEAAAKYAASVRPLQPA